MQIVPFKPFSTAEEVFSKAVQKYQAFNCPELSDGNIQAVIEAGKAAKAKGITLTRTSVFNALQSAAKMHIDLLAMPAEAYLTSKRIRANEPDGVLEFLPSRIGLVNYFAKHGISIISGIVKEGEPFVTSFNEVLSHTPTFGTNARPVAVYAIATDANGRKWHKILDWANIEKRMRLSKSKDRDGHLTGPWKEWPEEMAQTKCIRELAKLIGQREFNTTLAEVEEQDWIDVSPEPTIAEASQERPEVANEYNQELPPNDLPPIEEDDLPF